MAVLLGFPRGEEDRSGQFLQLWNQPKTDGIKPRWGHNCPDSLALAVGVNAAIIASPDRLTALNLADGAELWRQPLPAPPVRYGLVLNRNGRILVTLQSGEIMCFQEATVTEVP